MTELSSTGRSADVKQWIGLAARLVFGAVMLIAGVTKAGNIPETQQATRAYQLLGYELSNAWGMVMPWVEIVVGVFLIIGFMTRFAAVIGSLLMIAFLIGIISVWARGIKIDCGCFGGGGATADPAYGTETLRDIGLLLLSGWLVIWERTKFSVDRLVFG